MKKAFAWGALLAAAWVAAGCGPGIPEGFQDAWEGTDQSLMRAEGSVGLARRSLESKTKSNADNREVASQIGADALLKRADGLIAEGRRQQKGPLRQAAVSKDPSAPEQFREAARKIESLAEEAIQIAAKPTRALELAEQYSQARKEGKALIDNVLMPVVAGRKRVEGAVQAAKRKHPAKSDDLDRRLEQYTQAIATSQEQRALMTDESPAPSFAVAMLEAETGALSASRLGGDILERTSELDRSYSKTLIDMKAEYEVMVRRSSWNNFSEFSAESTYSYAPVVVSALQFARFAKKAEFGAGDAAALGLNPSEQMPSGHTDSTFWLEDMEAEFSHKYMLTENGQSTETGWEEVPSDFFYNNLENLGMDVLVKPEGVYEEDAMLVPMPPGFMMVNNRRCGQWVNRPEGRVWDWNDRCGSYRRYYRSYYPGAFILFSDWDDWHKRRRGRSAYYGTGGMFGTYGSAGSGTFRSTTWGQTGSLNRQDPAIRGLASTWRGGGPGGGGK